MDFSKVHRGAAYFGIGLEDVADSRGIADALALLKAAVDCTEDRDLRHDRSTLEALDFIRELMGGRLAPARGFQEALAVENPVERRAALQAAYNRLRHVVRGGNDMQL